MSTQVQELMDRILAGETVTPKELAAARAAADLAELQASAAAVREQEQAAAANRARLEALRERASTDFDGAALEAPRVRLEEALDGYLRAVVEHNAGLYRLSDEVRACAPVKGVAVSIEGPEVRIGDVVVRHVAPRWKLEAMLREALTKYFPRGTQ